MMGARPCGLASFSRSTGPTSGKARASPRQRATTRLRRTDSSALDSRASRRLHGRARLSQLEGGLIAWLLQAAPR